MRSPYFPRLVIYGNLRLEIASRLWIRWAPLTRQSVFNALEKGPESALTGPVVRGDVETIRRHLEALSDYASHLLPMYGAVLTETVHLAMRSGRLAPDSAVKLLDLVSEFLNREAS